MLESSTSLTENPYTFTDATKAEQLLKPLQTKEKGSYAILNQPKPNILLIILEGWTADVVKLLAESKASHPTSMHGPKKEYCLPDFMLQEPN